MPNLLNVSPRYGSAGFSKLSCSVKTSTSPIVLEPAKSTCNQSGNASEVPSFQPPPLPQEVPARSPSIAPAGAKPAPTKEDAPAVAPSLADATFTRAVGAVRLHQDPPSASVDPESLRARTCHQYVFPALKPFRA